MANSTSHHHPSASNSLGDNCSGANKSSQQYCLKWSNYSTNLVRTFGQMIMDENFVDVTLACEGQAIKAHKVVLSACSNYFKELFLANPCKHPIVILKDMKMEDLKTILDFMYKGEVNIFNHQLGALLKTADILKVKGLTESKDDEYDECHNQENTPPNNNTSNVNNNPISDLDKSGNLPYSGDRLLSVDRHPESSVNHIHSSAQSIYQAQLPPTSNQQIFHQPQTFHAPSSTPQSLPPPLTHDSNNQLKLSSSQESFKNSQQLQKPCSINRKKRRRRSKRVNDGLSMDRGGESDSGSMMSGDEETAIKKESKGRDDVISTPSCTATSSALDTNSNSNTVQSNNNSQSQEPNHSLTTGRKKLSLSTISQNVQSSNQDVLENSNFSHVDDSSEPWHDDGQIQLNEPIEEDDESNGVLNIKPLVSFDEGSGGESINNSISIPQDNLPVSQVQYKSHSAGNNESPSQVYKYSGQKCVCSVCHQSFTAYSSLRRHQEKHYPERRRYDCDICYKSYSRKDYLKEHRKHKHQM